MNAVVNKSSPYKLGVFDQIKIDGKEYSLFETTPLGNLLTACATGERSIFTHEAIDELRKRGKMSVKRDYFSAAETFARSKAEADHLFELPEAAQAEIEYKFAFCDRFLKAKKDRRDRSLSQIVADIHNELEATVLGLNWAKANSTERKSMTTAEPCDMPRSSGRKRIAGSVTHSCEPPGLDVVRRWLRILKKGNYNPVVLRDGRFKSGRNSKLAPEIESLLRLHAARFKDERRPPATDLYRDLLEDIDRLNEARLAANESIFACPSLKRFRQAIRELNQFEVYASRYTLEAASRKYRMIGNGLDETVVRALQRVEMDGWHVQLHVILKEEKAWDSLPEDMRDAIETSRIRVIAGIDYRSQCVVSLYPSLTESSQAAVNALRMIYSEKSQFAKAVGAVSVPRQGLWHRIEAVI